jgi:uncharacterized protein
MMNRKRNGIPREEFNQQAKSMKLITHHQTIKLRIWAVGFSALALLVSCGSAPQQQQGLDARLLAAVAQGDAARADSCLQAGADPNVQDSNGLPAILLAARSGQRKILASLLAHGADTEASRSNTFGNTALMEASVRNDTAIARLLLENGADVQARDAFGDPALNWAAYYGHVDYAGILLRHGARWDVNSRNGNALEIAAQQWHLELLRFFISQGAGQPLADAPARDLTAAVKAGQIEKVRQQLDAGAAADQQDELGFPLLFWAAAQGDLSMLQLLLERGAAPDAFGLAGYTPLAAAAHFGHVELASRLLDFGAQPDAAGPPFRITPLMCAAMGGQTEMMRLLLYSGADIDRQDTADGFTALMHATANKHKEAVALLVASQANPYIKSHDGVGLYELISYAGDPELAKIIEAYVLDRQH